MTDLLPRARATALAVERAFVPAGPVDDSPKREIWIGTGVAVAFFVLFLGWAAFARLDAAAVAPGDLTVAGHRQTIQHKEGGIVKAIDVKEGQKVNAGDVLVELAGTDAAAQADALSSQVLGLEAERARLQAEELGQSSISWPADFGTLTGPDRDRAQQAITIQRNEFNSRIQALSAQKSVLRQRTAELDQQVQGYRRQIEAADKQNVLIGQELEGVQTLAAKGYAPQTRVRALERNQAEIGGQRGQYAATIAQLQDQAGETRLQILQADKQRAQEVATQIRDVDFQLNELMPKWRAARDEVARSEVRSPTTGAVVGLTVFTPGAVIGPGQKLMDIVPSHAGLVIEARVSPNDAQDVHAGQAVEVRLSSLHDRSLPILKGVLTKMSADSFTDEKTGARYFLAEAQISPKEMAVLKGRDITLKPGLPAEVMVPLRRRTALQYLFEPLTQTLWRGMHER